MKIAKYYIDYAVYKAEDEAGIKYVLKIDYWDNKFTLSDKNVDLANFAKKLLGKKHRVNLVYKMLE